LLAVRTLPDGSRDNCDVEPSNPSAVEEAAATSRFIRKKMVPGTSSKPTDEDMEPAAAAPQSLLPAVDDAALKDRGTFVRLS